MVATEPSAWAEILAESPHDVAALARQLRAAALSGLPDLVERVYPGWRALGLRHPEAGLVANITARNDDVIVYLERGASLPDPYGLLEGADHLKQTRTLTFRPGATTPTPEHLVSYLDIAVDYVLGRGR